MRTYCIAQGTIFGALWWHKYEGNPKMSGYMYTYNLFTLLYSRNWPSSVKQLYSSLKKQKETQTTLYKK